MNTTFSLPTRQENVETPVVQQSGVDFNVIEPGCNFIALGNDRILLPEKSLLLKEKAPALELKIYDADVSMITPGGGGVHCMCQALRRDPG